MFEITPNDEKFGVSIEDELFLELIDKEVYIDDANCWVAPLPLRPNRLRLPN